MPSIIFVCTANKFRSPIAAAILKKEIDQLEKRVDWEVNSAGTWTLNGLPPPEITRQIGRRLELSGIENHRTHQVDEQQLEKTDLIIVMEANHKEALTNEFPIIKERIFLLTEVVEGKIYDIPDPATQGIDADEVAKELMNLISVGFVKILDMARTISRNHGSAI
jgi:protein-tyrosine phosphatase